MKISVDLTTCEGFGMCESFVPEVFEVGDDGELILHSMDVPEGMETEIDQAVENCPTEALRPFP